MRWSAAILMIVVCGAALGATPATIYRVEHDCGTAPACYATVEAALAAATGKSGSRAVVIQIGAGDFYEKVTVRRSNTVLRGAGREQTRLHFDAVAETSSRYHRNKWGTPGSATLTIDADRVTVENLTVENTYDFLGNDALPVSDPHKLNNSQAVALLLDIHSDRVLIRDASLLGYQDTLFANGSRAYILHSLIAGNIDFIFGNGEVLISDSEVRTRRRAVAIVPGDFHSFVTAPSTPLSQSMGIIVFRSRLTRENGVPDNSVALGRPWHPTTTFPDGRYADPDAVGQAAFIDCYMDAHIHSDHWASMGGTARDGTKTAVFRPQDARFSESGSWGPGARHADIGIVSTVRLSIDEANRLMFKGWKSK
jgi:pectinesterase